MGRGGGAGASHNGHGFESFDSGASVICNEQGVGRVSHTVGEVQVQGQGGIGSDPVGLAVNEMYSLSMLQDVQVQLLELQKQVETLIRCEESKNGIQMGLGLVYGGGPNTLTCGSFKTSQAGLGSMNIGPKVAHIGAKVASQGGGPQPMG